jgi:16S rRNA (guanine527-N7)-methyltransferase
VLATPGLTALRGRSEARRALLEDALRAVPYVQATPGLIIDVGSGGGSPGLPIAAALPDRSVTLLDAERRKCDFLRRFADELSNVEVVWGRAEDQEPEAYGVALAKALAKPPVAAELTLPLVREGGTAILWTGKSADLSAIVRAAALLSGELEADDDGLLVLRKTGPAPRGFPRKPGIAAKRPLA